MDRETFAARTESIRQRLYRTAYLYLGTEADALDAVDEAVYQALRALPKLRQSEFFDSWITRILINECHKELRRRKRFFRNGPVHRRSRSPGSLRSRILLFLRQSLPSVILPVRSSICTDPEWLS